MGPYFLDIRSSWSQSTTTKSYLIFFSDRNDSIMKSGEALNTLAEEIVELKEKCYRNLKVFIMYYGLLYVQEVVTHFIK